MSLQLFNTLTRKKEEFRPVRDNRVDFYSCGPTVYNVVHIGNLRSFLFADTLYRWLRYGLGHDVRWVMNITDVDDKTIRDSKRDHPEKDPMEALTLFTRKYEELFFDNLKRLHIERENFYKNPRATESIEEMQELIRLIVENGIGYEKEGSVYFSLEKHLKGAQYGKLVNLRLDQLKTGTRSLADEIEKENVQDFVLWKAKKEGEPAWDFHLNGKNLPGRPGWHIECSAMAKAAFEEFPFDIHSGGIDLQFPHHEDEIAQSLAGYKKDPVRYWVHNEHLLVNGEKMSKSLGNFFTLDDLKKKGHSEDAIRFFLVTNHYRTKLNLTEEAIEASAAGLERIRNFTREVGKMKTTPEKREGVSGIRDKFIAAMNDDLNTPKAVSVLFELLVPGRFDPEERMEFIIFAGKILGVSLVAIEQEIPREVIALAEKRKEARKNAEWALSDELRKEIESFGYIVRDQGEDFELIHESS